MLFSFIEISKIEIYLQKRATHGVFFIPTQLKKNVLLFLQSITQNINIFFTRCQQNYRKKFSIQKTQYRGPCAVLRLCIFIPSA